MNILVFDIETVPDITSARKLYNLEGLGEREAAEVLFSRRRQETGGKSDFLRHHLHRIVAISVLLRSHDKLSLWSLGDAGTGEAELVQRFFDGIERFVPQIVSWNGRGFDLPVLHYRALLHGIPAPRYWDTGDDDHSFRWNNYISRFHQRHLDLMDMLAGYEMRAAASLHEIASMLGFPGKIGMSGADVWEKYLAGGIQAIRDYCETDVINTYLVMQRFELMRGRQTQEAHNRENVRLREYLATENKPHLNEFLQAWQDSRGES